MSSMEHMIVLRFVQAPRPKSNKEIIDVFFKKFSPLRPPIDLEYEASIDSLQNFKFDLEKSDGFVLTVTDDAICFDYVISHSKDSYGFDINMKMDKVKEVVELACDKGYDVSNYYIKISQFYNGGGSFQELPT